MLSYLTNNKSFGPRNFSFNSYVSLIDQDFSRKVVLLREGEFTRNNIDKILNGKVYGLVVVTSENSEHVHSKEWIDNYQYLSQKSPNYSVYFINNDKDIQAILERLETEKRRSHIKLITTDTLAKISPKVRVTDFIGE